MTLCWIGRMLARSECHSVELGYVFVDTITKTNLGFDVFVRWTERHYTSSSRISCVWLYWSISILFKRVFGQYSLQQSKSWHAFSSLVFPYSFSFCLYVLDDRQSSSRPSRHFWNASLRVRRCQCVYGSKNKQKNTNASVSSFALREVCVFIFFLSAAARCRFVFMSIPSKWDCCRFDCHRGYAFVVIVLVCETQLDCRVCHSISFCEPVCVCLSTRRARRNICKILSQYENVYIHWVHDVVAI